MQFVLLLCHVGGLISPEMDLFLDASVVCIASHLTLRSYLIGADGHIGWDAGESNVMTEDTGSQPDGANRHRMIPTSTFWGSSNKFLLIFFAYSFEVPKKCVLKFGQRSSCPRFVKQRLHECTFLGGTPAGLLSIFAPPPP